MSIEDQTIDMTLDAFERLVPLLVDSWEAMVVSNHCPITAAAYLNIRADLYKILLKCDSKLQKHSVSILHVL